CGSLACHDGVGGFDRDKLMGGRKEQPPRRDSCEQRRRDTGIFCLGALSRGLLRATVPTLGCERFAARIFPQCIPSLNYRISSYAPPKLNGPVIASINAAARYGIVGEAIPVEQTDAYRPSRSWNGQGHDQLHREALRPEACQTCADTAYGSA